MRIAFLVAELPTTSQTGVPRQAAELADALSGRGHEVTVLSFSPSPEGAGYRVCRLNAPGNWWARVAVAQVAFAARSYRGFDVIHAHGDSALVMGRAVPKVRTFYGTSFDEARHAASRSRRTLMAAMHHVERLDRRTATVTVGISRSTEETLGPLDAVIPCGVDRRRFCPGPKSEHPSVLFVGTMGGRKRGSLLLKHFAAHVRTRLPSAELWMVTDEVVEAPGVHCLHDVDDDTLADLYRQAWVTAVSSSYEGFGVPCIESMASATAVVATSNAGSREVIQPGSGGVVVSDDELGPTLAELLSDHARVTTMGSQGRSYSARFGWDAVAPAYEQAYATALSRRSQRTGRHHGL